MPVELFNMHFSFFHSLAVAVYSTRRLELLIFCEREKKVAHCDVAMNQEISFKIEQKLESTYSCPYVSTLYSLLLLPLLIVY